MSKRRLPLGISLLAGLLLPAGVALGADPVVYRCDDGSDVTLNVIASEPPAAVLVDRGRLIVLSLQRSGSGARYTTGGAQAAVSFWTKGEEALYEVPGEPRRSCRVAPR